MGIMHKLLRFAVFLPFLLSAMTEKTLSIEVFSSKFGGLTALGHSKSVIQGLDSAELRELSGYVIPLFIDQGVLVTPVGASIRTETLRESGDFAEEKINIYGSFKAGLSAYEKLSSTPIDLTQWQRLGVTAVIIRALN